MTGLAAHFASVHVFAWGFSAIVGLMIGTYFARRDVATGTGVLILALLTWSMLIGLLPLINNALQPEGLTGVFSGRGFAQFLVDAAPQAIFSEAPAHRNEVLFSAGIGAVIFALAGLVASVVMRGDIDD
ncbi:hypothetical protein SAMN04488515_2100 [Cognatiyoonia koreensis]|uniref:Uncharacterized protein n=1 Tax=Cognatiyoonia koreensis TaxID=364200 RepID=A0A1I0QRA3_9RHOB|nr:hypothetical protein [Cognatiyoonia koreensis]SEW29705.1 hypothetical protein SAMN04488515_2100 [Cognatiyoonia koreensis]